MTSARRPASDSDRIAAAVLAQNPSATGTLLLRRLGLRELTDELKDLAGDLRHLDVSSNRLVKLPDWFRELLSGLETLVLAGNRLRQLDPGVGGLTGLRDLDLSDNRLDGLPDELAMCVALRRIDLSGNNLHDIDVVCQLPSLIAVDAANNVISSLDHLPSPHTLKALDLSNNDLSTLPDSFQHARCLRRLDLSVNHLTADQLRALNGLPLVELYLDGNLVDRALDDIDLPALQRFSALNSPIGQVAPPPGSVEATMTSSEAADLLLGSIRGEADPDRRYYDSPTFRTPMELSVAGTSDARRVLDLYYKQFHGLDAAVLFGDGTTINLRDLNRSTALDFVDQLRSIGDQSTTVTLSATKNRDVANRGAAFLAGAIGRVGSARLTDVELPGHSTSGFEQADLPQTARVLNVALGDNQRRVLPSNRWLGQGGGYTVRIDIGKLADDTIVVNPQPIRDELLDVATDHGYWFDVVVTSTDIDVAATIHRLFLPAVGDSFVCPCDGPEHVCAPAERRPYLWVPIRTREQVGRAMLRCTVYNGNNAIQSVRTEFIVGPYDVRARIRGVLDYALAEDAVRGVDLPSRDLNVLTNDYEGTHKILVKGADRAIAVDVTEMSAKQILDPIRETLKLITLGSSGSSSQFDENNAKRTDAFVLDLRRLAQLGATLWAKLVPDRDDRRFLREHLPNQANIQIIRVTSTPFPWSAVYDIPRELQAEWKLCPLLADWPTGSELLAGYPAACPYSHLHMVNTLCPFGFWGFRHLIEQPPTVRKGTLAMGIKFLGPAQAAVGLSRRLDQNITSAHLDDLTRCFTSMFNLVECESKVLLRTAFATPALPLVYFYCHGRRTQQGDTTLMVPALELGWAELIGPGDFGVWDESDNWGPGHWGVTAPLVFINGCETADLDPEDVVDFVDALAGVHVAGVIGTEIPVVQSVAGEIALRFYKAFTGADKVSVGTALRRMRFDMLRKGNVAGLVYTPFCSSDLFLEKRDV